MADGTSAHQPLDVGKAIAKVDALNRLCAALRNGYRRLHPDAPLTAEEREEERMLNEIERRHGIRLRPLYAEC